MAPARDVAIESVEELEDFVRSTVGDVRLDLSEVALIDAGGYRALIRVQRTLEARGRRLILTGLDTAHRQILEAAHLDEVIDLR